MASGTQTPQQKKSFEELYPSFYSLCFKETDQPDVESVDTKTTLTIKTDPGEADLSFLSNNSELVSRLREVNISCGLKDVPKALFSYKYLTVLNLSNNSLVSLPDAIGNLFNLVVLVLSRNKLKALPTSLKCAQQLSYVDISDNKFSEVPGVLYYGARRLKMLDMSHNEISSFDGIPVALISLVFLRISDNHLTEFPLWLFDNRCQLQFLYISENQLQLRRAIVNACSRGIFESLQVLHIENCGLRYEKLGLLTHFKNLQILKMGNRKYLLCEPEERNYMGTLKTDVFKNCKNLTCLNLQNAQIATLPSNYDFLENIEVLDLSCNLLSWLPESLCNLSNLRIINLTSNELLFLPENIEKLVNLEQIHLGINRIDQIPDGFYNLDKLEYVDLYDNYLEEINPNILKMKSLKGIDVELNYLRFDFSDHDVDADEVMERYSSLKDSFRRNFSCTERCDSQKEKPDDMFDETACESHSATWQSSANSVGELSDAEGDADLPTDRKRTTEDETWEEQNKSENEDENFDPNEMTSTRHYYSPWNLNLEDNFCPAYWTLSSNMPSAMGIRSENSPDENVVEGQFDDA